MTASTSGGANHPTRVGLQCAPSSVSRKLSMPNPSRLHVPHPPARPGDRPDFGYLVTSPAGAVPRPEPLARVMDIEPLATSLVRILDDDHRAKGPWQPGLS